MRTTAPMPFISSALPRADRLISSLLIALSALLACVGCKSTPDKEIKAWNSNLIEIQQSSAKYPNLAVALNASLVQAKKTWESAKSITDPEAQLAKMKLANEQVRMVSRPLSLVELKLQDVERDLNRLSRKNIVGLKVLAQERSLDNLSRGLSESRAQLNGLVFKDPAQAAEHLNQMLLSVRSLKGRSGSAVKRFAKVKRGQTKARIERRKARRAAKDQAKRPAQKPQRRIIKKTSRPTTRRRSSSKSKSKR